MMPIQLHGRPLGGADIPLICTPLVGRTRDELSAELSVIVAKAPDLIEWRVDFFAEIGDVASVIDMATRIRTAAGKIPILFTCRTMGEGGEPIALAAADVVKLYVAACASGCVDIIDYELSNPAEYLARLRNASRDNAVAMIMSYHNFQATPDAAQIEAKFTDAERLGADIAKVAVMPKDAGDLLTLLGATWRASRTRGIPLISLAMGGLGALSRMAGAIFGSALTFAVGKGSSAPGQIPIEELRTVLAAVSKSARR